MDRAPERLLRPRAQVQNGVGNQDIEPDWQGKRRNAEKWGAGGRRMEERQETRGLAQSLAKVGGADRLEDTPCDVVKPGALTSKAVEHQPPTRLRDLIGLDDESPCRRG
jgi:hypothetical protein